MNYNNYTTLKTLAVKEYAKRLTPIVNPQLQLLVDEAIEVLLLHGSSTINKTDTGLQVTANTVKVSGDLTPLNEEAITTFALDWKFRALLPKPALSLSNAYFKLTEHLNLEITTHGHLLRYINNVAQVRLRESDRWVSSVPKQWKGEELLTISKDADNQTAGLNQLNQTTATPFTDALKEILTQFEALVPLPQGIGTGDGQRFEQAVEIYKKKIEQCMHNFEKTTNAVDFSGFYEPPVIGLGADSATADGLLKQAKAQQIVNNTDNEKA